MDIISLIKQISECLVDYSGSLASLAVLKNGHHFLLLYEKNNSMFDQITIWASEQMSFSETKKSYSYL